MSESEPSGLHPPAIGVGGLQPMSLPPLSLPPIKTEQLGMSPMMTSFHSPVLPHSMMPSPHMSSVALPSNHMNSPGGAMFNPLPMSPHGYGLQHHFPAQPVPAQKKKQVGSATMAALQQHLISGRHNSVDASNSQGNTMDLRQIKSVPSSPNSFSNPPTPSSVPMMRYNSMDMVPSPSTSSHDRSPASHSNRSSPSPSPMPNGHAHHGIVPSSFASQSNGPFQHPFHHPSTSHPFQQRPPPPYQPPAVQDRPPNDPTFAAPSIPNGSHNGSAASTAATDVHPSSTQHHKPRTAAQTEQSSSHAIVQHLPLPVRPGTSVNGPPSDASSKEAKPLPMTQAVIQHFDLPPSTNSPSSNHNGHGSSSMLSPMIPPVNSIAEKVDNVQLSQQIGPGPSQLQSPASSAQPLLQQRLMEPPQVLPGSLPRAPGQFGPPPGSQQHAAQMHVKQMLAQRMAAAAASGNSPSPALQQALARQAHSHRLQQQLQAAGQQMIPHQAMTAQMQGNIPVRHLIAQQQGFLQHPGRMPPPGMMVNPMVHQAMLQRQQLQQQQQNAAIQLAKQIDERQVPIVTNKHTYRTYKQKFKYLVFENECYQEELRNLQRKLLKLSRDKNFLLDRLVQFEQISDSSDDDSDASLRTILDDRPKARKRNRQRKRTVSPQSSHGGNDGSMSRSLSPTPSPVTTPSPSMNLLAQMLTPSTSGSYEQEQPKKPSRKRRRPSNSSKPGTSQVKDEPQSAGIQDFAQFNFGSDQGLLRVQSALPHDASSHSLTNNDFTSESSRIPESGENSPNSSTYNPSDSVPHEYNHLNGQLTATSPSSLIKEEEADEDPPPPSASEQ